MVKIYSDASLVEFAGYKVGGWCSIIALNGAKISLQGKCVKKELNVNDLEHKASMNAILFAIKSLQIKPEELMAFVDNKHAYNFLKGNKFNVKIKFIGGDKKDNIRDKDKYHYYLCDRISKRITSNLVDKIKGQPDIHEIEEEKVGIIRTINDILGFIEREIEPIVMEKARMMRDPEYREEMGKNLDMLLEDSIDEYMNNKKIVTIAKISETNGQTHLYLSAKEVIQAVKLKKIKEIKERISCM